MNPFIPSRIYRIVTVNDIVFEGVVRSIAGDDVMMLLTTDSTFFFTNDIVTIPLSSMAVFYEYPQDTAPDVPRRRS